MGKAFMLPRPFADCITWLTDVMAGGAGGGDGGDNVDHVAPPHSAITDNALTSFFIGNPSSFPPSLPSSLSLLCSRSVCLALSPPAVVRRVLMGAGTRGAESGVSGQCLPCQAR